jgi:hypothetical protein
VADLYRSVQELVHAEQAYGEDISTWKKVVQVAAMSQVLLNWLCSDSHIALLCEFMSDMCSADPVAPSSPASPISAYNTACMVAWGLSVVTCLMPCILTVQGGRRASQRGRQAAAPGRGGPTEQHRRSPEVQDQLHLPVPAVPPASRRSVACMSFRIILMCM